MIEAKSAHRRMSQWDGSPPQKFALGLCIAATGIPIALGTAFLAAQFTTGMNGIAFGSGFSVALVAWCFGGFLVLRVRNKVIPFRQLLRVIDQVSQQFPREYAEWGGEKALRDRELVNRLLDARTVAIFSD